MAAHFQAGIYGEVEGNSPFQDASGNTAFSRDKVYPRSGVKSFSTAQTVIHPLNNGFQVTNLSGSFYMYSIVEVLPSGLNTHSDKFLSNDSAATLAADAA